MYIEKTIISNTIIKSAIFFKVNGEKTVKILVEIRRKIRKILANLYTTLAAIFAFPRKSSLRKQCDNEVHG